MRRFAVASARACTRNTARVQAPIRTLATYKTSTGLVGLKVDPEGRETLLKLSAEVLESVQKMPSTAQYRINVEKWFNFITKVATKHTEIKAIEDEIALGQIEEVIEMAKDELSLSALYFEQKGWEKVASEQARADSMVKDMQDSIYFTSPQEAPKAQAAAAAPPAPPAPPAAAPAAAPVAKK